MIVIFPSCRRTIQVDKFVGFGRDGIGEMLFHVSKSGIHFQYPKVKLDSRITNSFESPPGLLQIKRHPISFDIYKVTIGFLKFSPR
jgi:hypothetical protein